MSINKIDQYAELFELFHTASKKLKYPRISFSFSSTKITLSLAGKGYIAVKLDGEYQGKIVDKDSDLIFYPKDKPELKKAIETFASFPKYQAVAYGQKYNSCCFCGRELIEKASVYYGYGPICAENFGLPHSIPVEAEIDLFAALNDPDF